MSPISSSSSSRLSLNCYHLCFSKKSTTLTYGYKLVSILSHSTVILPLEIDGRNCAATPTYTPLVYTIFSTYKGGFSVSHYSRYLTITTKSFLIWSRITLVSFFILALAQHVSFERPLSWGLGEAPQMTANKLLGHPGDIPQPASETSQIKSNFFVTFLYFLVCRKIKGENLIYDTGSRWTFF